MKKRGLAAAALVSLGAAAALLPVLALPAQAHHSFSMFDRRPNAQKTLTGKVRALALINPHGSLKLEVVDASGKVSVWTFEMSGVNAMKGFGWTPATVKPGDPVTVTYFPLRFGSFGGQLIDVRLKDGRVLDALSEADRGYPKPK